MLYTFLLTVHIVVTVLLIILALIQRERSTDMMASSSASQTLFGSQGTASFIMKLTGWVAFIFFGTSMSLNVWTGPQTNLNSTALIKAAAEDTQPTIKRSP